MAKVIFKAKAMQFKNGALLIPATPRDKIILQTFAETLGNRYATVTANFNRANKSYDQVKTVFALIGIRFFIQYHRYPTETEQAILYSSFLWKYAPKMTNPLNSEEEIPIPLSQQSKSEAAIFISGIMADIYEYAGDDLVDTTAVELSQIFEEFHAANGYGIGNPIDYDENGNLLSEDKWRTKNHFSFASGVITEDLQLHHILSRGSHRGFKDEAWNWIMLTDYEHNRIIHNRGGWQKFLQIYPHCAKRIKNAYDIAKEMYPHELQVEFIKLGLIDEYSNDLTNEENATKDAVSVENLQKTDLQDKKPQLKWNDMTPIKATEEQPSNTADLAVQALKAAGLVSEDEQPYQGDIF